MKLLILLRNIFDISALFLAQQRSERLLTGEREEGKKTNKKPHPKTKQTNKSQTKTNLSQIS